MTVGRRQIPPPHVPGHAVKAPDAVDHRCGGTDGDKGIHVGGTVPKGLKSACKVFPVDNQNRQTEQELGQGEDQQVFIPHENPGQRPVHHMAHSQVKQGDHKHHGPDKPLFHGSRGVLLHFGGTFLFRFLPGIRQGCSISCLLHRLDNRFRGGLLLVKVDHHAVGQQADGNGYDAGDLCNGLLHMGGAGRTGHPRYKKLLLHNLTCTSMPPPWGVVFDFIISFRYTFVKCFFKDSIFFLYGIIGEL